MAIQRFCVLDVTELMTTSRQWAACLLEHVNEDTIEVLSLRTGEEAGGSNVVVIELHKSKNAW